MVRSTNGGAVAFSILSFSHFCICQMWNMESYFGIVIILYFLCNAASTAHPSTSVFNLVKWFRKQAIPMFYLGSKR